MSNFNELRERVTPQFTASVLLSLGALDELMYLRFLVVHLLLRVSRKGMITNNPGSCQRKWLCHSKRGKLFPSTKWALRDFYACKARVQDIWTHLVLHPIFLTYNDLT